MQQMRSGNHAGRGEMKRNLIIGLITGIVLLILGIFLTTNTLELSQDNVGWNGSSEFFSRLDTLFWYERYPEFRRQRQGEGFFLPGWSVFSRGRFCCGNIT